MNTQMLTVIILKRYSKYTEGYERGFRVALSQQPRYNCRDDFDHAIRNITCFFLWFQLVNTGFASPLLVDIATFSLIGRVLCKTTLMAL